MNLISQAARLSTCLWGGKYNPIIPAYDKELSDALIKAFGVDILHPLDGAESTSTLIEGHSNYLIRCSTEKEIFHYREGLCNFVDIRHPASKILDKKPDGLSFANIGWDDDDPLQYVFSTTFGAFPTPEITGANYSEIYGAVSPEIQIISKDAPVSQWIRNYISPINFSALFLSEYGLSNSWLTPGIFLGDANDAGDLVRYWNFRAAGASLLFYDGNYHERLSSIVNFHISKIRDASNDPEKRIYIWSHTKDEPLDQLNLEGLRVSRSGIDHTWNGLHIKPIHAYFNADHHDVISNYTEHNKTRTITFSLPDKPFSREVPHAHMQKFVVSTRSFSPSLSDDYTFETPYIPQLNEFYGRDFHGDYSCARSEKDYVGDHTMGLITNITSQRETVSAIDVQKFWKELFKLLKLKYERNVPGHRCANLIRQLGGLQGCRVLKVPGLRKLIHKYSQDQSFTQSAAQVAIMDGNLQTGESTFINHENLYIEYRPHREKLQPQNVFTYMVKRGLFRVGLDVKCTECFLKSWIHLDEVKTICKCDYCGNEFNITPFLKDRDWQYRRSGVLGLPKDKLDSIAVSLTLQQLDTCFRDAIMYSTSADIKSDNSNVENCEIDFLLLIKGNERMGDTPVQLLIGECKSEGGVIDEQDIRKLGKLADEMARKIGSTYIMFSKTGDFSQDEINLIKTLNSNNSRAIIWSPEQLEPYRPYERAEKGAIPHKYGFSLRDLAENTKALFMTDS